MHRLFKDYLYNDQPYVLDENRCIRLDDKEMAADIQAAVAEAWQQVNTDSLSAYADLPAYREGFLRLFGFEVDGVDYSQDLDPAVAIPSIQATEAV